MQRTIRLYASARRCYGDDHPTAVVDTYSGEAYLHASLRQFDDAFALFDEYFSRVQDTSSAASLDLIRGRSKMYEARGYLQYMLGNMPDVFRDYTAALRLLPDSLVARRARLLENLGTFYQKVGDLRTAETYLVRSAEVLSGSGSAAARDSEWLADVLNRRADLILYQAKRRDFDPRPYREALDLLQRSKRAYFEPGSRVRAQNLNLRSFALSALGQLAEAHRCIDEAIRYADRESAVRLQATYRAQRASLWMREGDWTRARRDLQEVRDRARAIGDTEFHRRALYMLGTVAEHEEAWDEAASYYRQGVQLVEAQRASLRATQWSLAAFGDWQHMHRGLIRAHLGKGDPAAAFRVLEQTRARHLADLRLKATLSEQLPPSVRVRYDSLTQVLTRVRNDLAAAPTSSEQATTLRNREANLMAQRRELAPALPAASTASLRAIQDTLRATGRRLVSYFLDAPYLHLGRPMRSHAFVVTPDTLHAVPLPGLSRDSVRALAQAVSPLFQPDASRSTYNAVHFDLQALHRLHEAVFAPLRPRLESRSVVVVPDGPLYQIPFSMLVTAPPPSRFGYPEAAFLVRERATSVALSASLLADSASTVQRSAPSFDADIAAFGVSQFGALQQASARAGTRTRADRPAALPDLPGVQRELAVLRDLFGRVRIEHGPTATESAVQSAATQAPILHLASHTLRSASSPLYNAIVLHGDTASGDDGLLHLHELRSGVGTIPLVSLSGCGTAQGTLWSGEGMQGLQYAFRAMGAQATLSTLWPASDDASVALSEAFYRHLQRGAPKDAALRQAQLDVLESPDHQSPFFWAPFVLYGSPASLPLSSPGASWWPLAAAGLAVVLVGGGVLYRRRIR